MTAVRELGRADRSARGRVASVTAVAALTAAAAALTGLLVGQPVLSPGDVLAVVDGTADGDLAAGVLEIRLPRAVLGLLVGAVLAIVGLLVQDVLNNPLAGPELLGAGPGAAVVMAAIAVTGAPVPFALQPAFALAGAVAGGAVVLLAAGPTGDPTRVVVLGAAVSALLNGLLFAVIALGSQGEVNLLFTYLLGSLTARGWDHVALVAVVGVPVLVALGMLARPVAAVRLGERSAVGLGIRVGGVRTAVLAAAAVAVAVVVAACGPVAFVALVAPHLARRLTAERVTSRLLGPTVAVGAALLAVADLAARTLAAPLELPVGVLTTVLAAPLLMLLVRADRTGARS